MVKSAKYASDAGVTLALQNHTPVIRDPKDVLRMVKEVDSQNLTESARQFTEADCWPLGLQRLDASAGKE